jgi:hypothetical protein
MPIAAGWEWLQWSSAALITRRSPVQVWLAPSFSPIDSCEADLLAFIVQSWSATNLVLCLVSFSVDINKKNTASAKVDFVR